VRTNKALRNKFLKAFLVTLVGGLVLVAAFVLGWRLIVRPPEIPEHAQRPFMPRPPAVTLPPQDVDRPAYDVVDMHPDDAYIGEDKEPEGWVRRDDFFTLLLFGYDDGINTDTIIVAAFDVGNRQTYLINIPRDTEVDVARNIRRINSAYAVGRQGGRGHAGGVEQLRREVQTIIGFIPDFYVGVDDRAFIRIIDAVGGININVPFRMYYRDPTQDLFINLPAGMQRLNGNQAMQFVQYRLGSAYSPTISDERRMQHGQMVIQAVLDELMSPRLILQVPELINTYRTHVDTDLTLVNKLYFAEQFILGDVTLHTYIYPTTSLLDRFWYEVPNQEEAIALINRTINPFTQDLTAENFQFFQR